jgi:hypothetical protein
MKRWIIFFGSILFFSFYFNPSATALEKCLASFPESAWSVGEPPAVTSFIQLNSKDYAGGLNFYEWEHAPGKWSKYDESNQSIGALSDSLILRGFVATIYRFPFWSGAKDGDLIRATYVYTGRNCEPRTVVVSPWKVYLESSFLVYENDYESFLKTISTKFSEETYYRNLVPKNVRIKLDNVEGEKLVPGKTYFYNRFEVSNQLPEALAESTLFEFSDGCFSRPLANNLRSKWWAGREGVFNKTGNCSAKLYFYAKPQGKLFTLYNYGTIDFTVAQKPITKPTATEKITITCIKGKLNKKVTAAKPKCPAGYKVKK